MDVPTTLGIEALKMEIENVRPESIPARHCGKNIEGYPNRTTSILSTAARQGISGLNNQPHRNWSIFAVERLWSEMQGFGTRLQFGTLARQQGYKAGNDLSRPEEATSLQKMQSQG